MRVITKNISLPLDGTPTDFRLTKLDAFSGARLLKLLADAPTDDLSQILFSLPEGDLRSVMETCLAHAEISLPAGFHRVLDRGCWALPELEYETWLCLRLTQEVISWTLEGFFPDGGQPS